MCPSMCVVHRPAVAAVAAEHTGAVGETTVLSEEDELLADHARKIFQANIAPHCAVAVPQRHELPDDAPTC